jgi:hypothetical protein
MGKQPGFSSNQDFHKAKIPRPGVFLAIMIISSLMIIALSDPYTASGNIQDSQTPTIVSSLLATPGTPLALTASVSDNPAKTNGIVLGGVLLVLIIIGGTLSIIRQKNLPQP